MSDLAKKEYMKKYRQEHTLEIKKRRAAYNHTHIKKQKVYSRWYYGQNIVERRLYSKNYAERNPEKVKLDWKNYYLKNRERLISLAKERVNQNLKNSLEYRFAHYGRHRVRDALKSQSAIKYNKFYELLGTTVPKARSYIEQHFTDGMNWGNHGKWHIDHKIPLSSFNLMLSEEQKKAFHYTNLQPLWAKDNLVKGDRLHA